MPHEDSRENPANFGQLEAEVEERPTVLPCGSSAAPPRFPAEIVGAHEPYAAFPGRKPHTRSYPVQRTGNPGRGRSLLISDLFTALAAVRRILLPVMSPQ